MEEKEYTVDYIVENGIDKKAYGFIYITTDHTNGMKYIGKKKFDNYYKWKNYLGSGVRFTNALNSHKKENFTRKIIDFAQSGNEINELEITYINIHDAVKSSEYYNLSEGGDGGNTYNGKTDKEKAEIGKKISKANSGKNNPNYGRIFSIEVRKNMSESRIGKYIGNKHHNFGKIMSDEQKQKISKTLINKSDEEKAEISKKLSESHTGKIRSESHRKAISKATSGEKNPMYGKHFSKEHKRKLSEAHIGKNKGGDHPRSKSIISLTTKEIFNCINDGAKKYKTCYSGISMCCQNKRKSAGKHPETNEPLKWMYYEDYIKLNEQKCS